MARGGCQKMRAAQDQENPVTKCSIRLALGADFNYLRRWRSTAISAEGGAGGRPAGMSTNYNITIMMLVMIIEIV